MTLIEWEPPLRRRHGTGTRLCGIDVYHDFEWEDQFGHRRATFPGGQRLTEAVHGWCPDGMTPVLVLTVDPNQQERVIPHPTHYIVVCDIRRYSEQVDRNNPVVAHFGSPLGPGIVGIGGLGPDDQRIRELVALHMNADDITRWAGGYRDRLEQLRSIGGEGAEAPERPATPADIAAAIRNLERLEAQVVEAVAATADPESRPELFHALTSLREGRAEAGAVIVERTPQRIADARAAMGDYEALLAGGAGETELQRFIERTPWLLGLEYTRVRHRHEVPRGTLDFILDRYDGYHDVLELKSPGDEIIIAPDIVEGRPPPAHEFRLSPDLANGIAQAHVYRDVLNRIEGGVDELYGLRETRDPLLIIVIGQASALPPHRLKVLTELNLSLHRVAIVPYDILGQRARVILDNVELHLTQAPPVGQDGTPESDSGPDLSSGPQVN